MSKQGAAGQVGSGRLSPYLEKQRILHSVKFVDPDADILDVGCGRARILDYLPRMRSYVGIDTLTEVIQENADRRPAHRFIVADIEKQELPNIAGVSIIVMLAILEHMSNPDLVFDKLSKLLNDGGKIILTTPHPRAEMIHRCGATIGLFSREAAAEHTQFFDRGRLSELAARSRLRLAKYERFQFGLNQVAVLEKI
jgi:2-polyprenyl-3-methyl-5-hydroxy-6-metoxy-1,4-benzoquinol methylase